MNDSNIKKIRYLSRYKRNKEKYIALENQLKGVHSIDLNYVKSTVHATLIDKIHKRDTAYLNMINSYFEINSLISRYIPFPNDLMMYDVFINGLNFDELETKMHINKETIKRIFNHNLNLINLE